MPPFTPFDSWKALIILRVIWDLSKPARLQLNLVESDGDFSDIAENKNLMVSDNSRLERLEQQLCLKTSAGGNTWVVGRRVFVVRWDYRGTTSRPWYHPLLHKYTNQRRKIPTHSERTANPQSPYQSNIQQYPLLELKDNVLKLKPEDKQKNFMPRVILRTFLVQPGWKDCLMD